MFYEPTHPDEKNQSADGLTKSQKEQARKGFTGLLWKLRYNPEFILNNCDELLALPRQRQPRTIGSPPSARSRSLASWSPSAAS